jgi:hypothetical protein
MANGFETERCASCADVQRLVMQRFGDPGQRWLFGGHEDAARDLASSLERVAHGRRGGRGRHLSRIRRRGRRRCCSA